MYQMNVADLPTLHKLDKRVAEAYPKGVNILSRFIPELTLVPRSRHEALCSEIHLSWR